MTRVFAILVVSGLWAGHCVAQHEFPAEIQERVADFVLFDDGQIGEAVDGFTDDIGRYFSFENPDDSSIIHLLCYRLVDSQQETLDVDTGENTSNEFSGSLFVFCDDVYSFDTLTDNPQFEILFGGIEGIDVSPFDMIPNEIRFLSNESLLDGAGDCCFQDFDGGVDCVFDLCDPAVDNIQVTPQPAIPLGGCSGNLAKFQLPGIVYVDNGNAQAQFEFANDFDFSAEDFNSVYQRAFFSRLFDPELRQLTTETFRIPLYARGDVNLDGNVDLLDVQPFVDCLLTDGPFQFQCDVNGDLQIDLLDVAPFVELLASG